MTTTTNSKHSHCVPIGMVPAFAFFAFLAGLVVALFLIPPPSPPRGWAPALYPSGETSNWRFAVYAEYAGATMEEVAAWYASALDGEVTYPDGCAYSGCFQVAGEVNGWPMRISGTWDRPGSPVFVRSENVRQDQQPATTTSSQ